MFYPSYCLQVIHLCLWFFYDLCRKFWLFMLTFTNQYLNFVSPVRNVALNGTASQSSTFSSSGEAGNANDGSLANNHIMGQCSITQRELSPWWMVDLESPYQIFSVVITNRVLECCKERIIGAEIRIGSSEENGGVLNPRSGLL